jgi:3-hydroxyacyl-CoA dehydrogenase
LIHDELRALARHGLADDPDGAAARLTIAANLQAAVAGADLVQENGPELIEQKLARHFSADFIICTCECEFRQAQV